MNLKFLVKDKNRKEIGFFSEIDRELYEYYKKYPELIVKISDWESVAICKFCFNNISLDHPCLYSRDTTFACSDRYSQAVVELRETDKYKCPHCKKPMDYTIKRPMITVIEIPHYIIRTRTYILEEKWKFPFFWKKVPSKYFREVSLVE